MAGTRRRSRISEVQDQRSTTSRAVAASAAAASSHAGDDEQAVEGARLVDTTAERSTTGHCARCKAVVGRFFNAWRQITGTYSLPALVSSYSCNLSEHGRCKPAAAGTDLDGCTIQPLACPRCHDVLGFRAVDVPEGKQPFRGRDFFKLSRIELQCEISPNKFQVVEPHIDAAPEPLLVDDSDRPSPVSVPAPGPLPGVAPPPADDMEVDSRPPHVPQPPPPPSGLPHQSRHEQHREHHHQPLQQVEPNRQSLPPPLRSPGAPVPSHPLPQKSPSNPLPSPAVKPVHDVQFAQPPSREASAGLANRTRELPPVVSHSLAEQHRPNGQYYPRSPQEVSLDAIERLQTQISQNSGALNVQNRDMQLLRETASRVEDSLRREFQTQLHQQGSDIRRVDEAVGRLQYEMRGIRELLETVSHDVQTVQAARSTAPGAAGSTISAQDAALELMAQQVAVISQKANEVDTLKITIEIMKSKIQRLEDGATVASAPAPPQPSSHPFPSPREPSAHSAHSTHTVPSYHTTPSTVPHINTPVLPVHRTASFPSSHSAATPEVSQRAEHAQAQSGWVTVNAAAKRAHPNGVDGPHDSIGQPVGSPKRPKLAPIEPRAAYSGSQSHPHHVYEHMDTDDSESRIQTHSHTLPSQTHSRESLAESPVPVSTLPSQHPQHGGYIVYGTQDAPSDDSWRPESQRIVEPRPRGRGRGGGPGSRGGRGRKSMPAQVHLGTPEWEREDWQGVADLQTSPDGYYSHVARSRGIIRRGSGGSSRGRPSSSGRAVSLGMQGVTTGVGLPADPYAHTKKTRTKPIRNADGILIRKDGRPDMRSQSSAANLRKVHARKEEQKGSDRGFTPTSSLQYSTNMEPETPSPTGFLPPGQDVTASVQKKHNLIMGKMFPGGVDESRKEHDYARKVFEEEQGHTAQPRGQHHHHHHHGGAHSFQQVKREQVDDRIAASQSPDDADVDMDRAEDHADDEDQTPSERSENSAQYQDAPSNEEERISQEEPKENGVQAVAQSTADTSQTLEAQPTPA